MKSQYSQFEAREKEAAQFKLAFYLLLLLAILLAWLGPLIKR